MTRAARRYYLTVPTMAYPKGRVALHLPGPDAVYVVDHTGQWDRIVERDQPGEDWTPLTARAAKTRLSADGHTRAYGDTPRTD